MKDDTFEMEAREARSGEDRDNSFRARRERYVASLEAMVAGVPGAVPDIGEPEDWQIDALERARSKASGGAFKRHEEPAPARPRDPHARPAPYIPPDYSSSPITFRPRHLAG